MGSWGRKEPILSIRAGCCSWSLCRIAQFQQQAGNGQHHKAHASGYCALRIFTPARQPTSLVARAQEPGSEYLANMGIYVFKREALFRCAKAKPESSTR